MSTATPRVFLPTLRELEPHLEVPIPVRVRILAELEFDLEALWTQLVMDGIDGDEARNRAVEALVPDAGTVQELESLHAPLYKRATERLRDDRLRFYERCALALVTGSVVVGEAVALLHADLLKDPSPFLWPVLGLGALLLAVILAKAFQLWIKGDHRNPAVGVREILLLSAFLLVLGVCGTLVDLIHLAGSLEAASDQASILILGGTVRESTLLSMSILLSLGGSLSWFVLRQWLSLVRGAHLGILGIEGGDLFRTEMKPWL